MDFMEKKEENILEEKIPKDEKAITEEEKINSGSEEKEIEDVQENLPSRGRGSCKLYMNIKIMFISWGEK